MTRGARGALAAATTLVGFAAETGDADSSALELARQKIVRKGCDLLMCNDVSGGRTFGSTDNVGWILSKGGEETIVPLGSKFSVAGAILDAVVKARG